jgi:hypothetical protein
MGDMTSDTQPPTQADSAAVETIALQDASTWLAHIRTPRLTQPDQIADFALTVKECVAS